MIQYFVVSRKQKKRSIMESFLCDFLLIHPKVCVNQDKKMMKRVSVNGVTRWRHRNVNECGEGLSTSEKLSH